MNINEYVIPTLLLPRRHYNAPCRVNTCTSVIGLTTISENIRNTLICPMCYKARKKIVNNWKIYIYKKRLRFLFLVTFNLLKNNHVDINKLISTFLI